MIEKKIHLAETLPRRRLLTRGGAACLLALFSASCRPPLWGEKAPLERVMPETRPGDQVLDFGSPGDDAFLGFGWSRPERGRTGEVYRWLKNLEGDFYVEISNPGALDLWLTAKPMYINWRRQAVGLFVNNHYVTEWTCADQSSWHTFTAPVPARFWRAGRNRLTLRAAYRRHHRSDKRELAFAVERVMLREP